MYSRYHDRPVPVPENYGGIAFSETAPPKEMSPHRLDVAKPTPPPATEGKDTSVMPPPPKAVKLPPKPDVPLAPSREEAKAELPEPSEKASETHLDGRLRFLRGMRFDDLLLLALLLMLSENGTESDVVLWLALLLFCG
ncbi:MAG: hypothetical protein IKJ35_09625 [Clostridia bacterium]|nr:hypothetical protein [Clostridia bacterium]